MPNRRKHTYRTARTKLIKASRVQMTIPATAKKLTRAGQEESKIQSPTMMGRINTQTMISVTMGNACTEFHNKSNHSRFTAVAIANPTHSSTKIAMA